MQVPTITPRELADRQAGGPIDLIDVRSPGEFRAVHAESARNVPLARLDPAAVARDRTAADGPLYVICQSGGRSRQACERLIAGGYANVANVEGGTGAWAAAGLPVVRGKGVISIERQVRIGAGSLALVGALLGWFVHPAFVGLSAFVGAGLVFAGVTDFCGMGLVLARMPWNRGPDLCPTK